MSTSPTTLLLASGSPRRRELLARVGVPYGLREPAGVDESAVSGAALDICRELAVRKARWVAEREPATPEGGVWVLGSDTVVVRSRDADEPEVIGKPIDREDARRILTSLSGETHRVASGVAVVGPKGDARSGVEVTEVEFRELAAAEIDAYLDTGDWEGKAGAYGIQSAGASLVRGFRGCWYNVVGLPLSLTVALLPPELGASWTCDCASMPLALPAPASCGALESLR